jgi:thiol-disulfide isomerase/thioredoxin
MAHLLELFLADHCPSCPDAHRRVHEFAARRPNVVVLERNVDHDGDAARRYGVFATPAVVIDGHIVLYGVPTAARLAAHCAAATADAPM